MDTTALVQTLRYLQTGVVIGVVSFVLVRCWERYHYDLVNHRTEP